MPIKPDEIKEIQKQWHDSTLDMEEFRKWDYKKQLDAIADYAKAYYSFNKKLADPLNKIVGKE